MRKNLGDLGAMLPSFIWEVGLMMGACKNYSLTWLFILKQKYNTTIMALDY